jgi:hypothetical protein
LVQTFLSAGWVAIADEGDWVELGAGAEESFCARALPATMLKPAVTKMVAVKNLRVLFIFASSVRR